MAERTGRPTLLTDKTAAAIVERLRMGCYIEEAAAVAGVHRYTVHTWMKQGAKARNAIDAGETTWSKLGAQDRRCLEFLVSVDQARDEWFGRANETLHDLGVGGRQVTTVTTKVLANGDVEETTKVEHLAPNPQVLQWRMEHMDPARYGKRAPLEINLGGQPDNPLTVEHTVSTESLMGRLAEVMELTPPAVAS